jgi:hypothetical protein
MTYEHFVHLLKDQVQIAALAFMAIIYIIKIRGVLKLNPIVDRTPKRGDPDAGMRYSLATIVMPWQMQSYRARPLKYIEFAVFHLAVMAAIGASFVIPYYPQVMLWPLLQYGALAVISLGLLFGISRLIRRMALEEMRLISSPDDYFSLILLNVWLLSALGAIPASGTGTWPEVAFFGLTAFFLVYVPFSKISHYILWPFNRYLIGKHFGKRGVYPKNQAGLSAAG